MTVRAIPPYVKKGAAVAALNAPAAAAASTDPYFANVVLLLGNNNGTHNSTTFTDQSETPHTITANGSAKWTNASAPTGLSTSMIFDGTTAYLSAPDSTDWDFGVSGDFTVEWWVSFANVSANYSPFMGQSDGGGAGPAKWFIGFNWTTISLAPSQIFWCYSGAPALRKQSDSWSPSNNTWYALALSRSGTDHYFYVDGVKRGTTVTGASSNSAASSTLKVGADGELAALFSGKLGPVRITKGVARWTTASYTVPTLPLPTS